MFLLKVPLVTYAELFFIQNPLNNEVQKTALFFVALLLLASEAYVCRSAVIEPADWVFPVQRVPVGRG